MADRKSPSDRTSSSRRLVGMGWELGGAIAGGGLLGYFIDYKFQTGRKGLLIGLSLGIIGGLYNLIKQSLKIVREEQKQLHDKAEDDLDSPSRDA